MSASNELNAPSSEGGKASLPLPPFPAFADLVTLIDAHIAQARVPVCMIGNDHVRDLVACIREQQAALNALIDEDKCGTETWAKARATLARWRIE